MAIDDEAVVQAVVARERERTRLSHRSKRKRESRKRRYEARHALSTVTFPLEIAGVYTEDLGSVTLHVDAIITALLILEQQRDAALFPFPEGKKDWQKLRLGRKYRAAVAPAARKWAKAMPMLMERWLTGFTERWTREEVLTRLEDWPREDAARALALPTVQTHIAEIRNSRNATGTKDRERLQRALLKLTARRENRGRRADGKPVPFRALEMYDRLLPKIQQFRRDDDNSPEALQDLTLILRAIGVPDPCENATRCVTLLFRQRRKPSRVAATIVAKSFDGAAVRRIETAVRVRPSHTI